MRIEILIGQSLEPLIYPIDKQKLSLGSSDTCDITVISKSVSRKHLNILAEDDRYFVIDQGSTNGTFINEERLIPGRKVEFTSFFPLRLGDDVLISLLSDESEEELSLSDVVINKEKTSPTINLYEEHESPDESTRVLSLRDLQKAKTTDLVKRRNKVVKNRTVKKSQKNADQEKRRSFFVNFLVIVILGTAAYWNFYMVERPEPIPEGIPEGKMGEVIGKVEEAPIAPIVTKLIPESELLTPEKLIQLLSDIKCTTDLEKYFCEKISVLNGGAWGAIQSGTTMSLILDGHGLREEALNILPPLTPKSSQEEKTNFSSNIINTLALMFIVRYFPQDLDYEKIKDLKIIVAFFDKNESGEDVLIGGFGMKPEALQELKSLLTEENIAKVRKNGNTSLIFLKDFIRIF